MYKLFVNQSIKIFHHSPQSHLEVVHSNSWLCLLPKYSHFSLTNSFQFQFSMQILTTEVVGCLYSKFSIILMQNRLSSSTELFVLLQFKFSSTFVGAVSSEWQELRFAENH